MVQTASLFGMHALGKKFYCADRPSGHMALEQRGNLIEIRSLRCSELNLFQRQVPAGECLKGRVVCEHIYGDMHLKDLMGSISRVGYCILIESL